MKGIYSSETVAERSGTLLELRLTSSTSDILACKVRNIGTLTYSYENSFRPEKDREGGYKAQEDEKPSTVYIEGSVFQVCGRVGLSC